MRHTERQSLKRWHMWNVPVIRQGIDLPSWDVSLRIVKSCPWIIDVISINSQHWFRFWSQELICKLIGINRSVWNFLLRMIPVVIVTLKGWLFMWLYYYSYISTAISYCTLQNNHLQNDHVANKHTGYTSGFHGPIKSPPDKTNSFPQWQTSCNCK